MKIESVKEAISEFEKITKLLALEHGERIDELIDKLKTFVEEFDELDAMLDKLNDKHRHFENELKEVLSFVEKE